MKSADLVPNAAADVDKAAQSANRALNALKLARGSQADQAEFAEREAREAKAEREVVQRVSELTALLIDGGGSFYYAMTKAVPSSQPARCARGRLRDAT